MIQKQCHFCAECTKNYPEDIAFTIYPIELQKCPRCGDVEFKEIESPATPAYRGAPKTVKPKPQKTMFD